MASSSRFFYPSVTPPRRPDQLDKQGWQSNGIACGGFRGELRLEKRPLRSVEKLFDMGTVETAKMGRYLRELGHHFHRFSHKLSTLKDQFKQIKQGRAGETQM